MKLTHTFAKVFLLAATLGFVTEASSMVIRSGADPDGQSANSNAAFNLWQTDVGGIFDQDNLNGLSGNGGTQTSAAGNVFGSVSSVLDNRTLNSGVISGRALTVSRRAAAGGFDWTFVQPVNAFGFFGFDVDNGTVSVTYNDGSVQNHTMVGDSLFWGISGIGSISSVRVTSTDPGGFSYWDNFVSSSANVPEPVSVLLMGAGLIGLGVFRRRA